MIHRLFAAPQRWMPCAQPTTLDTAQQDRFEPGETAVRQAAPTPQLRAIAEGRAGTAAARADQGLAAAQAAQARGESIWPWLQVLPAPANAQQSRRWAALVLSDTGAVPQQATRPDRMRLWFDAAWRDAGYAPPLAHWLAHRAPGLPVPPATLGRLAAQAADPAARAALGALFMRLGPDERVELLCGGDTACLSADGREALLQALPQACHPLVAQTWLRDRHSAPMAFCEVPELRPLNALLQGYTPAAGDCAAHAELSLVTHPEEAALEALAPWAQALLAQPAAKGRSDATASPLRAQRIKALGRFLFACRAANVSEATQANAAQAVAALLALPDEELRREMLWRLAGALGDPAQAPGLLALTQGVPAKALPLRLAAQLLQAQRALEPGLLGVLEARGLFTHGERARCLMRLMMAQGHAAYAREVLALTRPAHLRRVTQGPAQALALEAALEAAQAAASAQGAARTTALGRLDKLQAQSQALTTARLQLPTTGETAPLVGSRATLEALQRAFAWLAGQPGLNEAAGPAAGLCAARELAGPQGLARLAQCEAALAAQRPAAEGWQAAWCAALLRDLRGLTPQAAAKAPPPYPSAAARAVLHEHVVPLMLALAEYAPLVRAARRAPRDFVQAQDVLPSSLQWTGLAAQPLRALTTRCPDLSYVAIYRASMLTRWGTKDAARGQTLLKKLLHAMAQGRLDAERRKGAQARQLLRLPGGPALFQKWERCERTCATMPQHSIEDTGEPGAMLAAVTDIRSCQSARDGMRNQGMQARLSDGAKRMVVLRDAGGKLRARAMLRLMRTDAGRPVLLLSPLYVATGTAEADAEQALHAHVRRRAAELGVQAVRKFSSRHTALPVASGICRLTSESAPHDYWDEAGDSNTVAPVAFMCTLRELSPEP